MRKATSLAAVIAAIIGILSLVGPSHGAPLLFGRMHESYQPNKGKIFVLAIGNDARAGNPMNARADAIHIIGINTKTMKAGVLNFPRDSYVNIPGRGTTKLNEATVSGGPELLGRTLENLTGIKIDYWVMTGFEGFMGIVDGIGRVKVRIPKDLYDPTGSGIHMKAGVYDLGPKSSLAFLRTRHNFGMGDLTRTTNHGCFFISLVKELRQDVAQNPAALLNWISLTKKHAAFDLSSKELFRLGVLASQVSPKDIENVTVPASAGSAGAASVVFIGSNARTIYQRFNAEGSLQGARSLANSQARSEASCR